MRRFTLPLVILGCIALAALLTWGALSTATFGGRPPRAEVSGTRPEVATQALPPFARLDVSGSAEVVLVQGQEENVALPTASRKSGFVAAEVRDGTLYIDARDTTRWWDGVLGRHGGRTPQVVVTFKDLEAISAAGTVKVTFGDQFQILQWQRRHTRLLREFFPRLSCCFEATNGFSYISASSMVTTSSISLSSRR